MALDRARARVADEAIEFTRDYFGESFTFRFLPTMTQPAMEIVARVQALASETGKANVMEQLRAVLDFMDAMATDETGELIAEAAESGVMTINDLVELQMAVVSAVAGRPTTRSSSSPDGSPESGASSTASAPALASTPQG